MPGPGGKRGRRGVSVMEQVAFSSACTAKVALQRKDGVDGTRRAIQCPCPAGAVVLFAFRLVCLAAAIDNTMSTTPVWAQ